MEIVAWWEDVYARFLSGNAALVGGILAVLIGMLFLCLLGYLSIAVCNVVQKIKRRRVARSALERKVKYTLPDWENSYLRARLNTVLRPETEMEGEEWGEETFVMEDRLRLTHARALLCKVREAALSPADRLQTEELGKTLSLYVKKGRFATGDLRLLNDTLSALLKLSAKYEV